MEAQGDPYKKNWKKNPKNPCKKLEKKLIMGETKKNPKSEAKG